MVRGSMLSGELLMMVLEHFRKVWQKAVAGRHALPLMVFGCCMVRSLVSLWGFSFPMGFTVCSKSDRSESPLFCSSPALLTGGVLISLCYLPQVRVEVPVVEGVLLDYNYKLSLYNNYIVFIVSEVLSK